MRIPQPGSILPEDIGAFIRIDPVSARAYLIATLSPFDNEEQAIVELGLTHRQRSLPHWRKELAIPPDVYQGRPKRDRNLPPRPRFWKELCAAMHVDPETSWDTVLNTVNAWAHEARLAGRPVPDAPEPGASTPPASDADLFFDDEPTPDRGGNEAPE